VTDDSRADDGRAEEQDRVVPEDGSALEAAFAAYLAETTARAERLRAEASRSLTSAARQAAALGWSQRRIAGALGRSQPEVARLLRRVDLAHAPAGEVAEVGEGIAHRPPEDRDAGRDVQGGVHEVDVGEPVAAGGEATVIPFPAPADEPESMLGRVLGTRRDAIVAAAGRHGGLNVRVFGSVARGDDGPESDVDLLIDLEPGTGLLSLGRMEVELERILGRPVDVVPERMLKPRVAATVQAIAL
jgi:predicted nucleotidyltransferase